MSISKMFFVLVELALPRGIKVPHKLLPGHLSSSFIMINSLRD